MSYHGKDLRRDAVTRTEFIWARKQGIDSDIPYIESPGESPGQVRGVSAVAAKVLEPLGLKESA